MVQDIHVESLTTPRERHSDSAQPGHAYCCSVELGAREKGRVPTRPTILFYILNCFRNPARNGHHERKRQIRRALVKDTRRIRYPDISFPGRLEVNIVEAYTRLGDYLKGISGGVHYRRVNRVFDCRYERLNPWN
jgi:hypothetical protein